MQDCQDCEEITLLETFALLLGGAIGWILILTLYFYIL